MGHRTLNASTSDELALHLRDARLLDAVLRHTAAHFAVPNHYAKILCLGWCRGADGRSLP